MSATEIIEQIKNLPASERAQVARFIAEQDAQIPKPFKRGVANAAFAKWCGRGQLPAGKNTDDYLRLTRDGNGS
jgi:hypothetical protein